VKLFFLFHLENAVFIINVPWSTFPLIVEFDACQILPCGELTSQLQLQGHTSPFYDNPKDWTRTQGTGKTLISTIYNNQQSEQTAVKIIAVSDTPLSYL
jgi:hypothetical protein